MLDVFKNRLGIRVHKYNCSRCKDTGYVDKVIKPLAFTNNMFNMFTNQGVPVKGTCHCAKGKEMKEKLRLEHNRMRDMLDEDI